VGRHLHLAILLKGFQKKVPKKYNPHIWTAVSDNKEWSQTGQTILK
jgi:hypothetical protein